jgi:L-threonylcarbamoyladenylate synthase
VARLFEVKGRPAHNPIIVHVADLSMARSCAQAWPGAADQLAGAFWPGPLTLVVDRGETIPDIVTAGGGTVGLRWPSHPFIQAVIRRCGFPLAAPSANRSGELSPTSATHVQQSLGGRIPLIVDGGQAQVGIESTVVDLTVAPARVLRPGVIHEESLLAVLGSLAGPDEAGASHLKSPGLLDRHYAPRAPLLVLAWENSEALRQQLLALGAEPAACAVVAYENVPSPDSFRRVSVIPHDAEAYARALYAELHRCDASGAEWIVVEAVPQGAAWRGVADRLRRGSAR